MGIQRYAKAVAIVKQIVDEADPERLLELGAPNDEYDNYSTNAARRLLQGDDLADIEDSWRLWIGAKSSIRFTERLRLAQAMLQDQDK